MNDKAASPEQLEREITETRTEIDHKLAVLQQQLAPRRIAMQAAQSFGSQGGIFLRNLAATLRDNPVPTMLVAVGLCWLMVAGRNGRYAHTARVTPEPELPEPAAAEPAAAPSTAAALAAAETSGQGVAAQAARGPITPEEAAREEAAPDGMRGLAAGRQR